MEQPPCPPPTPTMGKPDNSVQIIFSEVICKNLVTIVPTARQGSPVSSPKGFESEAPKYFGQNAIQMQENSV